MGAPPRALAAGVLRPAATALAVAAMVLAAPSVPALATWLSSSATTGTFSTAVVEPVTALSVTTFCYAEWTPVADLDWQAPASPPSGYRVERYRDGVLEHAAELGGTGTTYRDIGLETNTDYTWHVTSIAGAWRSAEVTAADRTPHPCNRRQVGTGT